MPNFHSDLLVVAANEQDMRKVLLRFAANLAANDVEVDQEEAEAATTLDDLWRCVGGWMDARYDAAFVGAPLGDGSGVPDVAASWESPTSSAAGFQQQAATIGARLERLGGMLGDAGNNGATLSLATAPTGRYLSETANVSLTRYAQGWVVTVEYSTAWEPNYEDLDTFLLGLPPGTYGVGFFDADESDWYEAAGARAGVCHGHEGLPTGGELADQTFSADDLEKMGQERYQKGDGIHDVGDLAFVVGCRLFCCTIRQEQDAGEEEDAWDYEQDEEFVPSYERRDREAAAAGLWPSGVGVSRWAGQTWGGPVIDWKHPSQADMGSIYGLVRERLQSLPLTLDVSVPWGDDKESLAQRKECAATAERLVPGMPLRVTSRWEAEGTWMGVTLEVSTPGGALVGSTGSWEQDVNEVLALLLPHMGAYVASVVPLSARSAQAKYPEVWIRFLLASDSLSHLENEIRALLDKPLAERGTESRTQKEG